MVVVCVCVCVCACACMRMVELAERRAWRVVSEHMAAGDEAGAAEGQGTRDAQRSAAPMRPTRQPPGRNDPVPVTSRLA